MDRVGDPSMLEFHKIWTEQCEAALAIEFEFGTEKALGYLVGEKLMTFFRASDQDPLFAGELPLFLAEIRRIFEQGEIRSYLESVRRAGPLGHILDDEDYDHWVAEGVVLESPTSWAEDMLVIERIRGLLLD